MPSPNEYNRMAFESTTAVAAPSSKFGIALKVASVIAVLSLTGFMLITGLSTKPKKLITDSDKEEFRTTQFPPPQLDTPRASLDQGLIVIPPEPPSPPNPPPVTLTAPPPPITPPAPMVMMPNDDEARRLAELERQRLAEEEKQKWVRLRAPQLVADAGGTGGTGTGLDGSSPSANSNDTGIAQEDDPNRRFLSRASNSKVTVSVATQNKRIDALVAQGSMIAGVLETAIQSDLPGSLRAVTSEDVWSFDGRRILIPMGTRLIGEYRSGLETGQTRVLVIWTRLLRPDGVSVDLGSYGTDSLGRSGMTGIVDQHYLERYGSAIMLSLVGGAAQYIAGLGQDRNQTNNSTSTTYNPATGQTTTTQNQPNQQQLLARQIGAEQISKSLTQIANDSLKDSLKIKPTIWVDQGSPILIFVQRDLDFSAFYPDPVKEALRELRRGRRAANSISK